MSDGGMSCRLLRVCGAYMVKGCSLGDSSYPLGNRLEIATLQFERLCTLQWRKDCAPLFGTGQAFELHPKSSQEINRNHLNGIWSRYVPGISSKPGTKHQSCCDTSFSKPIAVLWHFDHFLWCSFRNSAISNAVQVTHWPSQCRASGCRIRKRLCSRWVQNRRRAPQMLHRAPSEPCSMSWRKPALWTQAYMPIPVTALDPKRKPKQAMHLPNFVHCFGSPLLVLFHSSWVEISL